MRATFDFTAGVARRLGLWAMALLVACQPAPKVKENLTIAFPTGDSGLRLIFSAPLDRESAEQADHYGTRSGLKILRASVDSTDPRRVTLVTTPMDGKALRVDTLVARGLRLASGARLPTVSSPPFLQGIASIEGVRKAHAATFPYRSRFEGIVATMSCGKNGGVWKGVLALGFTFIHEESGGPYSSIKVVTDLTGKVPNVIEEHHRLPPGKTLHLLWAGGVLREANGETQLVDEGHMEGSLLEPLKIPPPYAVKLAAISGDSARSVTAKSLEGVIVRLDNVAIDQVQPADDRGIRPAVLVDENGNRVKASMLSEVTVPLEKGQRFRSVRALLVRSNPETVELLVEWDGALEGA